MKVFKNQKSLAILGLLALCGLTSCSRGYGCPYDFSVAENLNQCSHWIAQILSFIY
ncbi:MAG: hypothetical protein IPM34_08550 [Saprospiraceae bacterium]|nr:hypothetical protein [Saprospiraceae bacterium]